MPMQERGLSGQDKFIILKLINGGDEFTGSLLVVVAERRDVYWLQIVPAWMCEWCSL